MKNENDGQNLWKMLKIIMIVEVNFYDLHTNTHTHTHLSSTPTHRYRLAIILLDFW